MLETELRVNAIEANNEQVTLEIEGSSEDEFLQVLRSGDLDTWELIDHDRDGSILTCVRSNQPMNLFRVGRTLAGAKLALTVMGRTVPSTEEACQEIIQHIPSELIEGTAVRIFIKDIGEGNHFGTYTSEFALDLFLAEVPGSEEPVPVAASGWIIQTQGDGSKIFWQTTSKFQLDASAEVRSEILWGTERFEGVTGVVTGTSTPEDPENAAESPFNYADTGWIRFVSED